jgi:2-(1,2-epoxy-1,2-dihydrophenyl)acetyl-CoA isomerase
MTEDLLFDVSGHVAVITLNRPQKLNAFTGPMLHGLVALLDECDTRDDVRAVVLTGAGRGFCSGGDVDGMGAAADNRPHVTKNRIWNDIQAFPKRAARFEKPLIAAVNGVATGGGMDLALACDIRVAAQSARFAETYAKIGLLPGGGGAWFLPRLVGPARALEMLWTAEFLDATQALSIGLVNHVYPDDELMQGAIALASRIAAMPPLSLRLIKRAVYQGMTVDMSTAFDLISSHIAIARAGHDHGEAIAAFREKRPGTYQGF